MSSLGCRALRKGCYVYSGYRQHSFRQRCRASMTKHRQQSTKFRGKRIPPMWSQVCSSLLLLDLVYDCHYAEAKPVFRNRGREERVLHMQNRDERPWSSKMREREKMSKRNESLTTSYFLVLHLQEVQENSYSVVLWIILMNYPILNKLLRSSLTEMQGERVSKMIESLRFNVLHKDVNRCFTCAIKIS